jgi:hypothetical protein
MDYLFRSSVGKSESKVKPLKLLVQFTLILKEASYVLRYDVFRVLPKYSPQCTGYLTGMLLYADVY